MANIKLKDANGNDKFYNNIEKVTLKDTDNNDVVFSIGGGATIYKHNVNVVFTSGTVLGAGTLSFNFYSSSDTPITTMYGLTSYGFSETEVIPACGFFVSGEFKPVVSFVKPVYNVGQTTAFAVGAFLVQNGSSTTTTIFVDNSLVTVTDTVTQI